VPFYLKEEDDPKMGGQWQKLPCWAAEGFGPLSAAILQRYCHGGYLED
jgi:hypothetical protein